MSLSVKHSLVCFLLLFLFYYVGSNSYLNLFFFYCLNHISWIWSSPSLSVCPCSISMSVNCLCNSCYFLCLQHWRRSEAERQSIQPCQTVTRVKMRVTPWTYPAGEPEELGVLESGAVVGTCPRKLYRSWRVGCSSIASMPTPLNRRSSVSPDRPTCLYFRWPDNYSRLLKHDLTVIVVCVWPTYSYVWMSRSKVWQKVQ